MQFLNSLTFTAITFVAFTALVAIISWWKTRGDNLDTQDGYYLAGRGLTGPVIAGSLLMTNLSAEQLVGNNGQAVRVGMSTMGWEVTSAIALVILAFVLMPKYLQTGLTTVPQFFEERLRCRHAPSGFDHCTAELCCHYAAEHSVCRAQRYLSTSLVWTRCWVFLISLQSPLCVLRPRLSVRFTRFSAA